MEHNNSITWYVLRKGRSIIVSSCKRRGYKVLDYADSKSKAQKLAFKQAGIALCLYA